MYPKLQSQGLAGGPNTGSCAAYAYYLEHENLWKKENDHRKDLIPFYDQKGHNVSVDTVIGSIDANKKGLHINDAKFFSLVINPSEKEAAKLGSTREEQLKAIHKMVGKMMDRYAAGFGKEHIKSHDDLLYFYTIHEYREDDDGNLRPGIHVHIIVSRKDLNGQCKLSPMTNHRSETAGVIKSGFNRDAFYRDCENIFDSTFNYQRRIIESYDYLNTLAHGNDADKTAMIRAAVKEEKIYENVSDALARRASRLAKEASSAEAERYIKEEMARMDADKKKKNEFFNIYYSYYRPTLDKLDTLYKETFNLYQIYKSNHSCIRKEISEQYDKLSRTYELIKAKQQEIEEAKSHMGMIKAFAHMMSLANPTAILIIALILLIILDTKISDKKADIQALRNEASRIREDIEKLVDDQAKMQYAQQDTLRQYIKVKDEKSELNKKLDELRKELMPPKNNIDLQSVAKELNKQKTIKNKQADSNIYTAYGIYGTLISAETKLDLDLELLTSNTVIEPVFHPNGGVADLKVIISNQELLASKTYSQERLTAMVEKWASLTGQMPAFRLVTKPEAVKSATKKTKSAKRNNKLKM